MYTFDVKFINRQDFPNNESIINLIITNNEGVIPQFNMFRKYKGTPESITQDILNNDANSIIETLIAEYENSMNQ